jgi:hypothetical protein
VEISAARFSFTSFLKLSKYSPGQLIMVRSFSRKGGDISTNHVPFVSLSYFHDLLIDALRYKSISGCRKDFNFSSVQSMFFYIFMFFKDSIRDSENFNVRINGGYWIRKKLHTLRNYFGIWLKNLQRSTENISHYSWSLDRDLNRRP